MKIKVKALNQYELELQTDAKKGDIIDLKEVNVIDDSYIKSIINEGVNNAYNKALNEAIHKKELENKNQILEIENKYKIELQNLNNQIKELKETFELNLKNKELTIKENYNNEINNLNNKLKEASLNYTIEKNNLDSNYKLLIQEKEANHLLKLNEQKESYQEKINELEIKIDKLIREKSMLNVKNIGEDLETWCDNEVLNYMQNGFVNCTWQKDNEVVKGEDETKGSKADFIFKIYTDEKHDPNSLLASICLEMKAEDPNSKNKKKNQDYYKQLDKNRIKKDCKYALLVSQLELDQTNRTPIYKVSGYKDMYVCEPAYLMTFLNLIVSLTMRFKDLVLDNENERLALKDINEILADFEKVKTTYLDNPLESLKKKVESIKTEARKIEDAANKINEYVNKITTDYINEIANKIERFNIKRIINKVSKID